MNTSTEDEMSTAVAPSRNAEDSAVVGQPGPLVAGGKKVAEGATSPFVLHVIKGSSSHYVKLNVGGCLYHTTIGTLTKQDSMLRAMFSGRMEVLTDAEGWILIDRCGKHFGTILNFLRDGVQIALPETQRELKELAAEARYYCLTELLEQVEKMLLTAAEERPIEQVARCQVQLVARQKEEEKLISSTTRPVVVLHVNRHNNKYSYTGTAEENLLKNVELFERMALRFCGRLVFIKDVNRHNNKYSYTGT